VGGQPSGRKAVWPYTIALVGLVALTACQYVDGSRSAPGTAGRDRLELAGIEPPAAASSEYPSLYSVPPRPRLSYTVQQQRAIVEGLVGDRELARYTDQVVRYRSGQSTLPPPPAPPRDVAAVATAEPGEPAPAAPVESGPAPFDDDSGFGGLNDSNDQDTLESFVDDLARDPLRERADETGVPDAPEEPPAEEEDSGGFLDWLGGLWGRAEPEASAAELATVPAMQPAPVAAPAVEMPDAAFSDTLPPRPRFKGPGIAIGAEGVAIEGGQASGTGRATGAGDAAAGNAGTSPLPAAAVVSAEPRAASVPAGQIAFAPVSAELPTDASAQLEEVLARAKSQGAVIRILGEASVPALALDRARAVGIALVRLGAGASDLEMTLAPGASGDQARLLLAGPEAR
jgi:hypothetical protein